MTPADIRGHLVDTLGTDLIGPDCGSPLLNEVLPQAPSRWYLTGFLVPLDAGEGQKADESAVEGVDELSDAGGGDDATTPEPAAARRAVFPSSMGLSLLVPKDAKELRLTVRWGDYQPVEGAAPLERAATVRERRGAPLPDGRGSSARMIRPKIVASTATVRRAEKQIRALFCRRTVDIFPPPGPDRRDSFFARTHSPEESHARLYLGIAAQGRSLKVILLRT